MDSVREGLRAGELERDTYDRLVCSTCGQHLKREDDPSEIFDVRRCPECDSEYREL
ncbi:MAG: HVO_0758 family zinc finger protein [Halanaeroarchaeum sp.]